MVLTKRKYQSSQSKRKGVIVERYVKVRMVYYPPVERPLAKQIVDYSQSELTGLLKTDTMFNQWHKISKTRVNESLDDLILSIESIETTDDLDDIDLSDIDFNQLSVFNQFDSFQIFDNLLI